MQKPNILYLLADDMGYGDVACLNAGSKIPTPNLDKLAGSGIRFTDAHAPSAVCTPTRYSVLTGRYCWRSRLKISVLGPWDKPLIEPDRLTVMRFLKQHGYATAAIGKWHLGIDWPTTDGKPIVGANKRIYESKVAAVLLVESIEQLGAALKATETEAEARRVRRRAELEERLGEIREDITMGILLSDAFKKVKEFSSLIKNLMNMSEKTGQTTMALGRITSYFDTVIPRRVKKMLSVLEPAVIVLAGLVVGFVLVGTILPIFRLYSTF